VGIVAIDLFCGAGGVTRGLLDAGINVVSGIDFDGSVKLTYEHNNSPAKFIQKDIFQLKAHELLEIYNQHPGKRLLAGCAPCQPFSRLNKDRLSPKDPRRTLLRYFADLVDEIQPDFVMMENVAGIAHKESDVLEYFLDILDKHGYKHDQHVVNAMNYGVPQNRKRYVLLASKHGEIKIPEGKFDGTNVPLKSVADTIKELPPIEAGEECIDIPNHRSRKLEEINIRRIMATPHDGGSRKDWTDPTLKVPCHEKTSGYCNVYGRIAWKNPAPTLTTKFHAYTSGRFGHPEQNRALSLREGALLQSFPKNYIFFGAGDTIARQIGNAVPPLLAYEMAQVFID
jgi:DNA (cytosine-5)-methyltransferase 1